MKYFFVFLLCIGLFCSCAETKDSSSSPELNVPETTTEDKTNESVTTSNFEMNSNTYVFTVTEKGVEITQNNEIIQTIEGNFLEELSSYNDIGKTPEEFIVNEDYDFDGYDDLFIPTLIGRPNTPGTYYRYNAETGFFDEWDELNKIKLLASANPEAQTITLHENGSAVDRESTVYKWDNSVLKPISRERQYYSDQLYIDTFEYDENGNQALVKRERVILDEDNNWLGTEEIEIPQNYSFSVTENSVDAIYNDELVQTLE